MYIPFPLTPLAYDSAPQISDLSLSLAPGGGGRLVVASDGLWDVIETPKVRNRNSTLSNQKKGLWGVECILAVIGTGGP
eukprot:663889-Prorocentrum_minimum.AAC.1